MDTRAAMMGAFLWWFCCQVELAGTLVNMVDGVVIGGIEIHEIVVLVPIWGVGAEGSIEFLGDRRGRGIRRKFITSAKQQDSVKGQVKIRVKLCTSIWLIVIKILVRGITSAGNTYKFLKFFNPKGTKWPVPEKQKSID